MGVHIDSDHPFHLIVSNDSGDPSLVKNLAYIGFAANRLINPFRGPRIGTSEPRGDNILTPA
jgi:hypothetical protein